MCAERRVLLVGVFNVNSKGAGAVELQTTHVEEDVLAKGSDE